MAPDRNSDEPERLFHQDELDDETIRVAPRCRTCGIEAPMLNSEQSLISKRGWRLVLETDLSGRRVGAWRCPECSTRRRTIMRSSIQSPSDPVPTARTRTSWPR
jgi:hypothetical protein